jgi:serine/threonine protein phosphatase PrpC
MPHPDDFLSACNTGLGWAFGTSRTGAQHQRNGRPCEDSFALWSGSSGAVPFITIAVADGHGDPRHDQSRTGAALATESAVEELVLFHRLHLHDVSGPVIRSEFKADFPRRVSRRWRDAVMKDAGHRMLAGAVREGESAPGLYTRYGSTLIAASVIADTILIGQIGDGDVVLVRPDGTTECPIPGDGTLMGSETRSLSSRDAHLLWRTATLDRGPGGVLIAATDGVSDSFDGSEGPEFMKFIQSLVSRIGQYGIENVAEAMSEWLDRYSQLASGDDMTIVFVIIKAIKSTPLQDGPVRQDTPDTSWGF